MELVRQVAFIAAPLAHPSRRISSRIANIRNEIQRNFLRSIIRESSVYFSKSFSPREKLRKPNYAMRLFCFAALEIEDVLKFLRVSCFVDGYTVVRFVYVSRSSLLFLVTLVYSKVASSMFTSVGGSCKAMCLGWCIKLYEDS